MASGQPWPPTQFVHFNNVNFVCTAIGIFGKAFCEEQ